jgi:hypothetical protein
LTTQLTLTVNYLATLLRDVPASTAATIRDAVAAAKQSGIDQKNVRNHANAKLQPKADPPET